jgi:cupin 2 domain-containing protein
MRTAPNLFEDLPAHLPAEVVQTLVSARSFRIERIISCGHASPDDFWYDQPEHEFVVVLRGAAQLRFEEGVLDLNLGSFINIPAHKRHRVEWTDPDQPTIWLAVYYGD